MNLHQFNEEQFNAEVNHFFALDRDYLDFNSLNGETF